MPTWPASSWSDSTLPGTLRLTVAYDGSGFHGFAANAGVRTVGGVLGDALAAALGGPVELTCAGRTDTGVHARGQVVSLPVAEVDVERLQRSVNGQLAPEVVVTDAAVVGPGFDARRDARSRRYRYEILNRAVPDPFAASYAWHVARPLDLPLMVLACDPLIGEHDFSAFCRRPKAGGDEEASLVRRVIEAEWDDAGDGRLGFEIEAAAFCHQMVRSIVGLMVSVGAGRRRAGEVAGIVAARTRRGVGDLAPPHGLCLQTVRYDGWAS